jgi:hypothetical protein
MELFWELLWARFLSIGSFWCKIRKLLKRALFLDFLASQSLAGKSFILDLSMESSTPKKLPQNLHKNPKSN